ncbi:MAG: ribosome biogenesis GTPase YlqF [Bacillota bacterium]|nr:MAG: ribosome biogenesis GTPase YlqF [Bacillota bacterium]
MKTIQWFPGHMTKALRMMEDNLKLVDGAVLVLDTRAAFACINPSLLKLFSAKPVVYALNKCDLAERSDADRLLSRFAAEGKRAAAVNAFDKRSVAKLKEQVFAALEEKLERNRAKGMHKSLRIMVAGIPNTGKSTLINALAGEKKAVTGDKAGVTKGKQWIKLGDMELLDTPGTMPPAFENQTYAKHLAYIGSINDDILDFEDLTLELLSELAQKKPQLLAEKYGITDFTAEPLELYNAVCRRRGFLLRGGEYDYERCAKAVIDDFRKGRIGKIALE